MCGAQWYPTTRTSPAGHPRGNPRAGPVHVEFFPIMVFYQNCSVSGSFELIYRVLKKTKNFAGTYPNVTVAGSTAASLGQRANVHTAVLSKCTHILAVLVK